LILVGAAACSTAPSATSGAPPASDSDIQITGPDATGWFKVNGNEMTGQINGILPATVTLRKVQ
jgi:hypothetical protein